MTDISIIIPIFNGEKWIDQCMSSIASQTVFKTNLNVEIVICNDGSKDGTKKALDNWTEYFIKEGVKFTVIDLSSSRGVGAAKNVAVQHSEGTYLCFQDVDDTMNCDRLILQWQIAKGNPNVLVGSRITRNPPNSTPRLVRWANNLTANQLKVQVYTSYGPTLLMPTWFCHRLVYEKVGGFDESGLGTPEDLIFFYTHLDAGGDLHRIDEPLVVYTYHRDAATFSVTRDQIKQIQFKRLEHCVLPHWNFFTVWNAGKGGRKFVRSLSPNNIKKVRAFCDVDKNKIGRVIELYCPLKRQVLAKLPVIPFKDAIPPILICVKLDLTDGQFESNLKSLNLIEGVDYFLLS